MKLPKLIVIVGPTASGKSDLAVTVARKFHGEVVSADSRQVYRGLNIGSGKITKREMRGVPHHLLDVADPKRVFTVHHYQKLATRAIKQIQSRGKLPILVGGTGFYIQTLTEGLTLPAVKPNLKLRSQLEKLSAPTLFKQLTKLDPKRAAAIDQHNKVRLIRAIEIATAIGHTPALSPKLQYQTLLLGLLPKPATLNKRIATRLDKRLRQGLIAEVKRLHTQGLSWRRLEALGLEYRYVALYLQGKLTKPEMADQLTTAINQYAKRQLTWFKRNSQIHWIASSLEAQKYVRQFIGSLPDPSRD